ncbi:MAG: nucleotidyl transferase AbiEii/AbiGii toxin family protein, partial [Bacteroidota bacterium]|nr:nucleotidyl transferase AbiEii/AbiGii toxin family protein [Bacteroidota bacterium]
ESILEKVIESSTFKSFELDEHRSFQPGVPKAHYAFAFDSSINTKYSGKILLDVLIEKSIYPEHIEKPILAKWIDTDSATMVSVPSVDSITGDKLTAFAPNTTGIPYFKGDQSFAMEICKQLFDLSRLFHHIEDMGIVEMSFQLFAEQEIAYRNNGKATLPLTPEAVLKDTIDTCLIITTRGAGKDDQEKANFKLLQKGIQAFGTGFLMSGNFRIDEAIVAAAQVAHLAAKLMFGDLSSIQFYEGQDIKDLSIENQDWNFLNRLKRQPDKSSFYYWYHTVELFTKSKT